MSRKGKLSRKIYDQEHRRGATAIIVAIVLVVLLGIAALAVDIGYLYAAKNELQNAADAAALAGARQLGDIYSKRSIADQETFVCGTGSTEEAQIKDAAIDVASKNKTATQSVVIDAGEVEIGIWDSDGFKVEENQPNAVRVTARRDGSTGATVGTFFAQVLGIDDASVVARATAALTAQSTTEPGELELPIGISEYRFTTEYCNKPIKFSPTKDPDACAGWHAFDQSSDASTLEKIIQGMIDGTYSSPGTVAGTTTLNFTGGEVASVFDDLAALLEARNTLETEIDMYFKCSDPSDSACKAGGNIGEYTDGIWNFYTSETPYAERVEDNKDNPIKLREWQTGVVVYEPKESDPCGNPTGSAKILGYASVKLWCVLDSKVKPTAAQKLIVGEIVCNGYYDGRGGGSTSYGTKGTIPGLVE